MSARLSAEVAAQHLQFDGAQHDAALRLDALRENLLAQSPKRSGRRGAVLRSLRALVSRPAGATPMAAPRGVYLWGGVGRGKTLLMDLFFASVSSAERMHFYHFMRDVHTELARIRDREQPLAIVAQRFAERARVICLDEFLVADIADAMILAGLIEGLFRCGVTLVATSNLAPRDLYKEGLQRSRFLPAIGLLENHLDVVHLDGGVDYRLRQLKRAPTYMDSTLPGAAVAMAERFAAHRGGVETGPQTLIIEGRPLEAKQSGPGLAWFEFDELCNGPRSQNDYIELARLYHTLFVANVPVFGAPDEDAARRFIMLIDELYDRSVKLVVSAAAAPAALYRGERLHFEFERAASRLVEMQSSEYLAAPHRA